jgi:hypothetical protein
VVAALPLGGEAGPAGRQVRLGIDSVVGRGMGCGLDGRLRRGDGL